MFYVSDRRRHYVVIPSIRIGYGRIPKAANSTLKRLMARAGGIEDKFENGVGFSRDRNWRSKTPHAYLMTAAGARRRFPDVLLFSIVREPLAWLASCYRSKITRPDDIPLSFRREGLTKDTSFANFVAHVATRPDWRSNIHYRSQANILKARDGLVPDFIGRFETLYGDLDRLSAGLVARGRPPLPKLAERPKRVQDSLIKTGDLFDGDEGLIDLALQRYAADFDLFYSGKPLPGDEFPASRP